MLLEMVFFGMKRKKPGERMREEGSPGGVAKNGWSLVLGRDGDYWNWMNGGVKSGWW